LAVRGFLDPATNSKKKKRLIRWLSCSHRQLDFEFFIFGVLQNNTLFYFQVRYIIVLLSWANIYGHIICFLCIIIRQIVNPYLNHPIRKKNNFRRKGCSESEACEKKMILILHAQYIRLFSSVW
jgi:hypothetical protein